MDDSSVRPGLNANFSAADAAKFTLKDSVFCNLFKIPEYTLQFYRYTHPEDTTATADLIQLVTLENVFLNQQYNDLGFTVRDKLLILVEAQSSWSVNILVRILLYAAQTIQQRILDAHMNIYASKKLALQKPEFYVIYTGDRKTIPDTLTLSEEFFDGTNIDLNVTVHVLKDEGNQSIVSQYIHFTRIYNEQVKRYGKTREAVTETLRICMDKDILREYLIRREKEVIDIMMTLFDNETILQLWLYNEKEESRAEGMAEGMEKGIQKGMEKGIQKGMQKGIFKTYIDMVRDGDLSPARAAQRLSMTEEEFLRKMAAFA